MRLPCPGLRPLSSSDIALQALVRSGCLAIEVLSCKRLGCGAGFPRCPFLSAGYLDPSRVARVRQRHRLNRISAFLGGVLENTLPDRLVVGKHPGAAGVLRLVCPRSPGLRPLRRARLMSPEEPAWSEAVEDEEWGHAQRPGAVAPDDAMNRPRFSMNWLAFTINWFAFTMNGLAFSMNCPRFIMNRSAFTMNRSAFAAISAPFMENPAPFTANRDRLTTRHP